MRYTPLSHCSITGSKKAEAHSIWRPPGVLVSDMTGKQNLLSGKKQVLTNSFLILLNARILQSIRSASK